MKQILIPKNGPAKVLKIVERDDPKPGKNDIFIRVKASGINFADILARKGLYPDAPKLPCVVGYEVSGVVEAVGEGVDENLINREVLAITRFNGYSDCVVVPQAHVFDKPDSLTFELAAAIPVVYLTAYQLIITMGSLQPGESILIHNAGGGVGLAALDIAKHIGAITYGTASSGKHEFLKERGLDYAIDYRNKDWTKELKDLTDNKGLELILDPIGGSHWKKSYRALRSTGRLGMFGISSATQGGFGNMWRLAKTGLGMPWFHPISLLDNNKGVYGVNLGHLWHEVQKIRKWMEVIIKGVEEGWVRPHVDKSFPFAEIAEAHKYIEDRKNIGKVIITP